MGNCILNRTTDLSSITSDITNLQTNKQDKLTAGSGISLTNNVVSNTAPMFVDDQGTYSGATPINADLLEGHDTSYFVNELGCIEITIADFNSLPQTVSNNLITSDSVVINSVLSNPAAQTSDWTVTSTTGALEVSGTISGTTSLTMYLVNKQN